MANTDQIKKYENYLKGKRLQEASAKSYVWHAKKFFSWFDKRKLTEENLKKYREYLLHSTDKISSINLHLVISNDLLAFLKKKFRYDLLSNKVNQAKTLSKKQLDEFLELPNKTAGILGLRNKALIDLLYSTGMKVGNLIKLKKEHIDEIKRELIVDERHIPLNPSAWSSLHQYISARTDEHPWLFINYDRAQKSNASHLSVRSVERIIEKYARQMQPIIKINPQILRNTLALHLKEAGAEARAIKDQLHFHSKVAAQNYLKRI